MLGKSQSWKTVVDKRRNENFVGRADQLRVFSENFATDVPTYMVFAVTGEGGVGKSTLLKQFEAEARAPSIKANVIACDDKQTSPAAAMGHIAGELADMGISDKEFDERYKKYQELCQEIEGDPKAPRSFVDVLALGISDFTIKSLRRTPGVGVFFEGADEKAAGEALAGLANYAISRWGNKDEVLLLREPERVLTPLFLELLNKATETQRLVLMFDVFERTGDSLSPWLLALCGFEYGEFGIHLTFVISGRDPLDQHWTEMSGNICRMMLEPFTLDETRLYLSNQRITDKRLAAQIHEDTGGLPVLVELLAATKPTAGVPLPDISKDAVERFLQWTPQEERRRVALLAAVPRQFNQDILGAALGSDAAGMFSWLAAQSYIRTNTERGWFYHEKVRELMLRYLRNTTPGELAATHERLVEFFATAQQRLGIAGKAAYDTEAWRVSELERVFHALGAQPDHNSAVGVNAFLHAFRLRWRFAEFIAQVCRQASLEANSQALREVARTLSATYVTWDHENFDTGVKGLDSLELTSDLTPMARHELYALRAWMYCGLRRYKQSLADWDQAMKLDDTDAWAIAGRGETNRLMGEYEQALVDSKRAIAVDERCALAMLSRGTTYKQMGQHKDALAELNRALTLLQRDVELIARWGKALQLLTQCEETLQDIGQALTSIQGTLGIVNQGLADAREGRYEQALVELGRAIALDENNTLARLVRGMTYMAMAQYQQAREDFNQAITLDQHSSLAMAHRGETYLQTGQLDQALADLNRAVALDEEYAWAIARRGLAYLLAGKCDDALVDLDRAIALDRQGTASRLFVRALAHEKLGHQVQSEADLNAAIELARRRHAKDSHDVRTAFHLALYYLTAGQGQGAKRLYGDTLAGSPPVWQIRFAMKDLEQLLLVLPDHAEAQAMLIMLQEHIKDSSQP